jgi:hypothetical protein
MRWKLFQILAFAAIVISDIIWQWGETPYVVLFFAACATVTSTYLLTLLFDRLFLRPRVTARQSDLKRSLPRRHSRIGRHKLIGEISPPPRGEG